MKQIIHMNKDEREDSCVCPSFSCYSNGELAEIALKVAAADQPESEFEFTLVHDDHEELIAYDGRTVGKLVHFPVFNRDLFPTSEEGFVDHEVVRSPGQLRNVNPLVEDEQKDESENIPEPGRAYCVWPSPMWCRKSKSTGSAPKQWKLRHLFRRSNSEGEGDYVVLSPKPKAITASSGAPGSPVSAHEMVYVWNRTNKEAKKKRTYLPYRQDIVGFFSMAKGLPKITFPRHDI